MAMNIDEEASTVATRDRPLSHPNQVMILVPDRLGIGISLGSLNNFTVTVDFCPGHPTDDDVRPPAKAIKASRSDRTGELCRI